jgi:hypothetical protein
MGRVYFIFALIACSAWRDVKGQERTRGICTGDGEHAIGKWVNGTRVKKTYYCCGWDSRDNMVNPTVCGWSPRGDEHLMYGHQTWLTQTGGHASSCDKRDGTRDTVTQRERYEWKPMLCDLLAWNASQFCELVGNRTFLFLGDSTMHQTAAGLMSQLTSDGEICAEQLAVARINELDPVSLPMDFVTKVNPDVVVLNVGAHFMTMDGFMKDLQALHPLVEQIRTQSENVKNVTLLWKTMNPPHVNCSAESGGPLNTNWPYKEDHGNGDHYNWYILAEQDVIAKRLARSLGMKVVDMSPLYKRQDAHSDCLHFCLPGPTDLFQILLLNMMYIGEV